MDAINSDSKLLREFPECLAVLPSVFGGLVAEEDLVMFREMILASKMFQFEWMEQSMGKRNRCFYHFKWGCGCNHVG